MPTQYRDHYRRIAIPCETCGIHFYVWPWESNRKYHNRECYLRRPPVPLADKFWDKVDKLGPLPSHRPDLGPCWIWTATRNSLGYGPFYPQRGMTVKAHRWAYETLVGPVAAGYDLDHLCRNPACVRPDHLEPVPHWENIRRGYEARPRPRHTATHCRNGHAYDEANTRIDPKTGERRCLACGRKRTAAWRATQPRRVRAPRPEKTHCPHGHPYDAANTYVNKRGVKECRTCKNAATARRKARTRARAKGHTSPR